MRVAVIPAVDEAATLGSVILQTQPHVDEVIVVDDGSGDATGLIASRAGAEVRSHERNRGKGAALRTGIGAAIDAGADVVVLLDGDGQHDPESIPSLVEPIEAGDADLVIGSRRLGGAGTPPRHRKAGRRVLDAITNVVGETDVSDTQSGFRAMRADWVEGVEITESGFGVESVMLTEARRSGARIVEIDVAEDYPSAATPNQNPMRHAVDVVRSLLRVVRRDRPLVTFGVVGLGCLLLGGYLGFDTATHYWSTREFWPGRAMLSMLFSIIGTQLLTAAIILDFIGLSFRTQGRS